MEISQRQKICWIWRTNDISTMGCDVEGRNNQHTFLFISQTVKWFAQLFENRSHGTVLNTHGCICVWVYTHAPLFVVLALVDNTQFVAKHVSPLNRVRRTPCSSTCMLVYMYTHIQLFELQETLGERKKNPKAKSRLPYHTLYIYIYKYSLA